MIKIPRLSWREWILLFLLIGLGTGMGFYYWLFAPLWEQNLALGQQLQQGEQELALRQEWQRQDRATQALLQDLQAEQAALQAQLSAISHEQDAIDYVVDLGQRLRCEVRSLEIEAEQINLRVIAPNYQAVRSFLLDMEQSPNIVPVSTTVTENQDSFSLQLQARITFGQRPASQGQTYPRTIPFGR